MGLLSGFTDALFGGVRDVKSAGAFPGLPELGGEFQKYLLQQLQTPASESMQFQLGSQAIRDQVGGVAGAARQRVTQGAQQGGYLDSGVVGSSLQDVDRAELSAFSSSLRDLLLGLEDRRTQNVLPFLSAGEGMNAQLQGINAQSALGQRGQNISGFTDFFEAWQLK